MSAQTEVTKFAEDLIETPKPHLRLRLYQDSDGLKLSMDKNLLISCPLTKFGMIAGGFIAKALGTPVPAIDEEIPIRISTGVLFRIIAIAELNYSQDYSYILLERLLEEAEMQRSSKGAVSDL